MSTTHHWVTRCHRKVLGHTRTTLSRDVATCAASSPPVAHAPLVRHRPASRRYTSTDAATAEAHPRCAATRSARHSARDDPIGFPRSCQPRPPTVAPHDHHNERLGVGGQAPHPHRVHGTVRHTPGDHSGPPRMPRERPWPRAALLDARATSTSSHRSSPKEPTTSSARLRPLSTMQPSHAPACLLVRLLLLLLDAPCATPRLGCHLLGCRSSCKCRSLGTCQPLVVPASLPWSSSINP